MGSFELIIAVREVFIKLFIASITMAVTPYGWL